MAVQKKVIERNIENMRVDNKLGMEQDTQDNALKDHNSTKNYDLYEGEDLEGIRSNYGGKEAGSGCLTIINHTKDGVRLQVANEIWRDLGCPEYIRPVLIDGDLILFAGTDVNVAVKFNKTMDFDDAVANYKSKIVLYASKTAKRLVAEWGLLTEEQEGMKKPCSFTGGKYSMVTIKGKKAAAIVFPHETFEEEVEE